MRLHFRRFTAIPTSLYGRYACLRFARSEVQPAALNSSWRLAGRSSTQLAQGEFFGSWGCGRERHLSTTPARGGPAQPRTSRLSQNQVVDKETLML